MQITIDGKEYEVTELEGDLVKSGCLLLKPIQTPQFKVGDRVILVNEHTTHTKEMVYRLLKSEDNLFDFKTISDRDEFHYWTSDFLSNYFKPYEKPEVGDDYWFISPIKNYSQFWIGNDADNRQWNLGLAFHKKEQAEFARERLSKLF